MAQVIWTTSATLALEEIAAYIDEFSERYAKEFVQKTYKRVGQLTELPYMGRKIPEIGLEQYRELIDGNYRIMYELLDDDIILVQRIIHQAQNFQP
jgi:toxin ParE1/3/4